MSIKRKILIVDDDESLQDMVRMLLEHYDFECYTALNVKDGLSLYEQHFFDLILLDIHFQEIDDDGLKFLDRIRNDSNNGVRTTPVLVMSSDRNTAVVDEVLTRGVKAFVAKPLQPLRFVKSVYEYVN